MRQSCFEWVRDCRGFISWWAGPDLNRRPLPCKGSVAVDGISLTLVDVIKDSFSVCLIPHTLSTTLGCKTKGASVNIEADVIGNYVRKSIEQLKQVS